MVGSVPDGESTPPPHSGGLAGVRVVDAATVLAAPLAASLLGDFGAEVIKIEQPGVGDAVRTYGPFDGQTSLHAKMTNRNKQSITLDFHFEDAVKILLRLVAESDVVILNFRPRQLKRWGIDYSDLRAVNPRVIVLHLTAFGREGPYSDRPGFARVAEAFAGLTFVTGDPESPPVLSGYPLADGIAGMYGAYSIMVALHHRAMTGEGQLIDLALYEPILRMMEDFVIGFGTNGEVKQRVGNVNPLICPNGLFPTADEKNVILPISTEAMWKRLVAVIDRDELKAYDSNAKRLASRSVVDGIVAEFTSAYDAATLCALLTEAEIPCAQANSVADIAGDAHIAARGNLTSVYDEELKKDLLMQFPVPTFSSISGVDPVPGRGLGADNHEIFVKRLGYSTEQLANWSSRGVI